MIVVEKKARRRPKVCCGKPAVPPALAIEAPAPAAAVVAEISSSGAVECFEVAAAAPAYPSHNTQPPKRKRHQIAGRPLPPDPIDRNKQQARKKRRTAPIATYLLLCKDLGRLLLMMRLSLNVKSLNRASKLHLR